MIESAARHGAGAGCCGTCLDARGITEDRLVKGAHRPTLEELADWTLRAHASSRSESGRFGLHGRALPLSSSAGHACLAPRSRAVLDVAVALTAVAGTGPRGVATVRSGKWTAPSVAVRCPTVLGQGIQ